MIFQKMKSLSLPEMSATNVILYKPVLYLGRLIDQPVHSSVQFKQETGMLQFSLVSVLGVFTNSLVSMGCWDL